MGRSLKHKVVGKQHSSGNPRPSKYSRPLKKEEIDAIAFLLSGGEQRLAAKNELKLKQKKQAEEEKIRSEEQKKKQIELKAKLIEKRKKAKPRTEKEKNAIKLTIRNVMRNLAERKGNSRMGNLIQKSTSSTFRLIVTNFPQEFKEVMNEPKVREQTRIVLKGLGKKI